MVADERSAHAQSASMLPLLRERLPGPRRIRTPLRTIAVAESQDYILDGALISDLVYHARSSLRKDGACIRDIPSERLVRRHGSGRARRAWKECSRRSS